MKSIESIPIAFEVWKEQQTIQKTLSKPQLEMINKLLK